MGHCGSGQKWLLARQLAASPAISRVLLCPWLPQRWGASSPPGWQTAAGFWPQNPRLGPQSPLGPASGAASVSGSCTDASGLSDSYRERSTPVVKRDTSILHGTSGHDAP